MADIMGLFGRGLVVGFTIAAAIGPISLLVIRRTIAHGRAYGLASGLGVASADASYGGIAAFGLTAISGLLISVRPALGLVGGAFVVLLGLRSILSRPGEVASAADRPGLATAAVSIYALTMTNPLTILSFAAVFAGFGFAAGATTLGDAAALTLGVWAGSGLWWAVLTAAVTWLRGKVSYRGLTWVNRASGAALVAFGLVAIAVALGIA
ncbi:MAG TPA: LysE family transporter [Candidatus Limnocylindrales bacterium]|nr:LysE family transporter [Candidatus Limnocylindrales bacterium]